MQIVSSYDPELIYLYNDEKCSKCSKYHLVGKTYFGEAQALNPSPCQPLHPQ